MKGAAKKIRKRKLLTGTVVSEGDNIHGTLQCSAFNESSADKKLACGRLFSSAFTALEILHVDFAGMFTGSDLISLQRQIEDELRRRSTV